MAEDSHELVLGGISSPAVREATGRGWREWLGVLDAAGAGEQDHKQVVAYLQAHHPEVDSGWWRQSITVAYEQARGKRVVGQTADGSFQVGVQRTVAASPEEVWELITARPELWLGEGITVAFEEGAAYEAPAGPGGPAASGEVRVVRPRDRVRLTWHPENWSEPARIQLRLSTAASGGTTISAHMEKLPDADARVAMREHWHGALKNLAIALTV